MISEGVQVMQSGKRWSENISDVRRCLALKSSRKDVIYMNAAHAIIAKKITCTK